MSTVVGIALAIIAIEILVVLLLRLRETHEISSFRLEVYPYLRKRGPTVQLIIPHDMKAHIAVDPQDAAGNITQLDGPAVWTSADEAKARVEPLDELSGLEVYVLPSDVVGDATQITVMGDARFGEETKTIELTIDVLVSAAEATGFGVRVLGFEPKQ